MNKAGLTLATLAAVGALAACGPPQNRPLVRPNTPAEVQACADEGGTPLRDPQPPRPASDPGPTFICQP